MHGAAELKILVDLSTLDLQARRACHLLAQRDLSADSFEDLEVAACEHATGEAAVEVDHAEDLIGQANRSAHHAAQVGGDDALGAEARPFLGAAHHDRNAARPHAPHE